MLKLRLFVQFALAAMAVSLAQPAPAQSGGLGAKLDEAEKKLDADIKACRPIDVKDYQQLSIEANQNGRAALDAAHAGLPIDAAQVNADSKRARALFERARAAASKPCPPPNQSPTTGPQPNTPQPNTPPAAPQKPAPQEKKVEPPKQAQPPKAEPPFEGLKLPKSPFQEFEGEADDTMNYLDWGMASCNEDKVKELTPKLEEMAKKAHELAAAAKAAGKFSSVDAKEAEKLADDLDEAVADAKKFKCPKKPPSEKPKSGVSYELNPFASRILDIHNEERFAAHVPPLRWNFQLQRDATQWADQLAVTHQLVHAPREGRGIERENIGTGLLGVAPDQIVRTQWIEGEKPYFHAGYFPDVCSGEWTQCAHYSQVIWPTTTDIGCGYATGGGYGWLVCRYSPGGNKDGKPVGLRYPVPERG